MELGVSYPQLRMNARGWQGKGGGRVPEREGGAEWQEWQLPPWVAPSPGHTHIQLLVTVPSHPQTERRLQLHKPPAWSQEDAFRRYGREGDSLTPNLEGGEGGPREEMRQIRGSRRTPPS